MPIQRCTTENGGKGWKFGESGHCYASRSEALKQMRAIKYSQTHSAETLMEKADKNIIEQAQQKEKYVSI